MKWGARAALLSVAIAAAVVGCDDEADGRLILDVEGPRGVVEAPGPWLVRALTARPAAGTLYYLVDGEGALRQAPLIQAPETSEPILQRGIEPLEVGASVWWFVEIAGERVPPCVSQRLPAPGDGPLAEGLAEEMMAGCAAMRVVAPRAPERPDAGPGGCSVAFLRPLDGQALGEEDDGAAQAGFQVTVQVRTDLEEGSPVVLAVDGVEAGVSVVGTGEGAFRPVDVEPGRRVLTATGQPPFGEPCQAEIIIDVPQVP